MSKTIVEEKEFSDNNINIKLKRLPGCLVSMDISISPDASKGAYAKAIKKVNKEISLPGFRKGKAPESVVIQKFLPQIKESWENILFNTAVHDAFTLAGTFPALDENKRAKITNSQIVNISKDQDSHIKIEFETLPIVPAIDTEALTVLPSEPVAIGEKECEDRLIQLLLSKATWETLDRTTQEGDFVDAVIKKIPVEGEEKSADDSEDEDEEESTERIWIRKDKMIEKAFDQMLGKQAQDSFTMATDDQKSVNITISAVLKPILPEANDAFAKQFGADTMEMLKANIELSLKSEANKASEELVSQDLIKQLLEKFPIDVPASLIKKHRASIISRTLRNLEHMLPESNDEQRKEALKELDAVIDNRSVEVLHLRFLAHAFARENGIKVDDEEFKHEMTQLYYNTQAGKTPYIDFSENISEIQSEVYNQMITQKVLESLIEKMREKN